MQFSIFRVCRNLKDWLTKPVIYGDVWFKTDLSASGREKKESDKFRGLNKVGVALDIFFDIFVFYTVW